MRRSLGSTASRHALRRVLASPHIATATTATTAMDPSSATPPPFPLRIPVVSYIDGLGDLARAKLRVSTSPAGDLFRAAHIELVDMPLPPTEAGTEWPLSEDQLTVLVHATVVLGDAHTLAPVVVTPETVALPANAPRVLQNVQWMQATYAGVEHFHKRAAAFPGATIPTFRLSRAGGIMPRAMAQYVFGWVVAIERKFFEARALQAKKDWNKAAMEYRHYQDVTVGILGLGDIGQEIGRLLKTAGFNVLGFKRNVSVLDGGEASESAHRVTNNLQHVLEQSDFLVSVLPSTNATRGLLHERNLVHCAAKKPVLINVGRGDLVSEQALLTALDNQWLSRAVLDVLPVEPLPKESKLWDHPRIHITPHVSAKSFPQDVADVFVDNLNRFLKREPLEYAVNWSHGY